MLILMDLRLKSGLRAKIYPYMGRCPYLAMSFPERRAIPQLVRGDAPGWSVCHYELLGVLQQKSRWCGFSQTLNRYLVRPALTFSREYYSKLSFDLLPDHRVSFNKQLCPVSHQPLPSFGRAWPFPTLQVYPLRRTH